MTRLTLEEARALRDEILRRGWRRDLIAVESWGANIANGSASRGFRVVLAWLGGGLKRITSIAEAEKFLPAPTTLPVASPDAHHALPDPVPVP